MNDIVTVISAMHAKGIRVWTEGGKIHYRSAAGQIAREDIDTLRERKPEILQFLERAVEAGAINPTVVPRRPSEPVPLTFSQQASWRGLRRFGMKYNTRFCTNAMR